MLSERGSAPKVDSILRLTTAVFVTVYFVHGVDHLRRGLDFESTPVIVIGIVQTLLVLFAVVLVARPPSGNLAQCISSARSGSICCRDYSA